MLSFTTDPASSGASVSASLFSSSTPIQSSRAQRHAVGLPNRAAHVSSRQSPLGTKGRACLVDNLGQPRPTNRDDHQRLFPIPARHHTFLYIIRDPAQDNNRMASFVTDLWESIFTPGPTPTLLRAANATFLALQLTLAGLLFATYSIHCVILSIICAGLWCSVNWFAAELAIVQREQAAKDKAEEEKRRTRRDDGSDTEVEEESKLIPEKDTEGVSASKEVEVQPATQGLSQRKGLEVESAKEKDAQVSQSSVSTEDEWEKVSEGSKEKDQ
ncbi:uncharacterized protein J7T54_006017 [Emericellopsis cladophorae]|uniref:Uncharacterized protein n=1 Tax=Emericellopsis cladophorae TaxID=2686198 RepID=A0A9P9Y8T2_9HYPO|nr:uncharacterized protein J7T54_006017 [Emericellopsis cladophorae]KAI6785683.1 hypothetical protein J7T54_006017 [Emericellopsis cladophorae]